MKTLYKLKLEYTTNDKQTHVSECFKLNKSYLDIYMRGLDDYLKKCKEENLITSYQIQIEEENYDRK